MYWTIASGQLHNIALSTLNYCIGGCMSQYVYNSIVYILRHATLQYNTIIVLEG